MQYALWLLVSLLLAAASNAQVIHGRVTDAETGFPMPEATIHLEGTYRGTITNGEGRYELKVDAFPVTLVVGFVGYATARRVVVEDDILVQDFSLVPAPYLMPTITVGGEDPAISIMHEVIERKKRWRSALDSYEVQAYSRFTIAGDSSIVWIMESASTAYWDRGRGMKERITGSRSTANSFLSESVMPVAQTVANLYDDNLFIAGHNLVGVTHPDALGTYDFSLEGTRMLDGVVVYDILVEPKSRLGSAFRGNVAILDSAFAMIGAELQPGESFLFPQPIKRYEVTYRQQFSSFGGDYWMPVDFRSKVVAEISVPGLLSFPAFNIDHVARFTDYQVNVEVPEDLYAAEGSLVVDSVAVDAGEVFTEPGLVVPLTTEETAAYDNPDIEQEFADTFTPGGLVGRMAQRFGGGFDANDDGGELDTNRAAQRLAFLDLIQPSIWYNRVEGMHLGWHTSYDAGQYVTLGGGAGWNSGLSGSDRWAWHVSAGIESSGETSGFVEGQYEARVARRYGEDNYPSPLHNGLAMVLGRADYFDYYGREGFHTTAGVNLDGIGMRVWGMFRNEDHKSLPLTTSYDVRGRPPLGENPAITPGRMQSVSANLTIGRRRFFAGRRGNRTLRINAEFGTPKSDYSFQRFWLDATWRQPTLGRRRLLPAMLDLRFKAGLGSDDLPTQRAFIVDNQLGGYAQFGALRSSQERPFEGDDLVAFFWEHNFRTMIFEILRLRGLVRRGYSIMVFGGHARTWLPDRGVGGEDFRPTRIGTHGSYHELGVSLGGVLGFMRIDFSQPLGGGPIQVGVGAYSPF